LLEQILAFSVRQRWIVVLATLAAAVSGAWSLTKLPIDAVPDVTNVQVQINAIAPALTPIEIEKQVTLPLETALAGTPGLASTRSFSRNGFAQITAVFTDRTDIHFARQQVTERLNEAKAGLPLGVELRMGPISTGLGEVYWWSVEYAPSAQRAPARDGKPGWQNDDSYLTPEGERLTDDFQRTVYLRTVQDWIIRPQMRTVPGVAGADAIGGYVKQYHVQPDPERLVAYGLSFHQVVSAIEANNVSRGANYIERNGEGYVVRVSGRVENLGEIEDIVIATRGAVPVRIRDVAQVTLGRELRTGSANVDGREVVLGTALMLIGGNSRTVAAAANAKIKEINRVLPPGIRARTVLNRTQLVDATIHTVATNLADGALLVVLVLFVLLGNFRAALVTAMVIPITMLMTATGMLQGRLSANLMSLGALDFGLIVDGAVIIAENSLRRLAEGQYQRGRVLALSERLDTVTASAKEMIQPTVYGQAIIMLVYVPLLTFTGVEGKTFAPMAFTVIIALASAFVLSLTFVPAMIAIVVAGRVQEKENLLIRALKVPYRPALAAAIRAPLPVIAVAVFLFAGAILLFTSLGQEFTPILDEKNIVMEVKRIPSTSLSQSQSMQLANEDMLSRFPQVAFVFSRTGTPDLAADPMPPSASDTYIIMKPRDEWPDPDFSKEDLIRRFDAEASKLPGNKFGFSQPIEMRFNELIAGVREDLAVKVFGDEFAPMVRAANQIAAVLRGVEGTASVKVEEVSGLPFLEIKVDKGEIARRGLSLSEVQDTIGIAIGGRAAGLVLGRRSSLPDHRAAPRCGAQRYRGAGKSPHCPAANNPWRPGRDDPFAPHRQLQSCRRTEPGQPGKWEAACRCNCRNPRPRHRLARRRGANQGRAPRDIAPRLLVRLGRTIREFRGGAATAHDRRAAVLCADIPAFAERIGFRAGRASCVQRGSAGADRRRRRPVAARHDVLDLGRGRVHRLVRHCRPQWAGHPDLHQAADRGGRIKGRRDFFEARSPACARWSSPRLSPRWVSSRWRSQQGPGRRYSGRSRPSSLAV
jgi:cobalt-zinc-cadmium resistance protein CzcA